MWDKRPEGASGWKENVLVGKVRSSRVDEARELVQGIGVNNTRRSWNCQSWVMKALRKLEDAGLIELDGEVTECLVSEREEQQQRRDGGQKMEGANNKTLGGLME